MNKHEAKLNELALKLFEVNAFKFGDFKMKVGINSPVYFDLRVIVSYPKIMNLLTDLVQEYMTDKQLSCDHVCGVPYTALPIATLVSIKQDIPMLVRRKEAKSYGTKKMIEGKYKAGDKCLIIEDVVTSGSSVLETVRDLRKEGVDVADVIVVVDREQGGVANISQKSVRTHSIFTLSYLLNILKDAGKIEEQTVSSVAKYIEGCQIKGDGSFVNDKPTIVNEFDRVKMTFEARSDLAKCEVARKLFKLMASKKTNLCLAADLTKSDAILEAADICGPYICVLKTHVDIIDDFNENFVNSLTSLAKKHNFLIMEDRKFADIGNTVALQYTSGLYRISNWADLVTSHSIPGQSVIQGLKSRIPSHEERGVFLLAEMSCRGSLINEDYKEATVKLATESSDVDFIAGIVCQNSSCFSFPGLIQLTPGVKICDLNDDLGQQYQTPEFVVKQKGADIGVVGRGILESKSMLKTASEYRDQLWMSYCERVGINC